jgi:serine/threonine-protein kinase
MGEVYKARDTKLDREVAVKVLPASVSRDPERLARFEREAKVLASLNHPNIAQIYAVADGALVMELVQGQTLAGPLPLETTLSYARQIAEALEAAHEKGIIHRDLKPGNIMVTPEGVVKVLDFGLASRHQREIASNPDNSPTLTLTAKKAGVILGTAAYMSPEQAAGKPIDRRSDIWSFGVVLWEMLTGKGVFEGETASDTLANVLKAPIDFGSLPSTTLPTIRVLLERCLDRDPKTRLRDIGEARIALDGKWPAFSKEITKWKPRTLGSWAAASILAVAALIGWLRPAREPQNPVTLSIAMTPGDVLMRAPVISPDGLWVWYATTDFRMYVRRIDSLEVRSVPGRAGLDAFWSPDSKTVFYWGPGGDGRLLKVRPTLGVQEVVMSDRKHEGLGTWSDSGALLLDSEQCLDVRPPSGGEPRALGLPQQFKDSFCLFPEFLPGGEDFLFLAGPAANPQDTAVYLGSWHDGKAADPVLLLKNPTGAHYTPAGGGRILYVRNDNLYAQKLNRRARRLEGDAEVVTQGVESQFTNAYFSVARNGTIAWRPGKADVSRVVEFDRSGQQIGASGPPGIYSLVAPSPDGNRLLLLGDTASLIDAGQPGKLDLPRDVDWFGWSADGSKLIGTAFGTKGLSFVEVSATGSGELNEIGKVNGLPDINVTAYPDVSYDGKQIIFSARSSIYSVELDGKSHELTTKIVMIGSEQIRIPSLSPDRHWIVYDPGEEGVYVRAFPGPGRRRRIGTRGANSSYPYWRKDGNEILYFQDGDLMSVVVSWHGEPSFAEPRKLFSGLRRGPGSGINARPLVASHDGSRIFWLQGPDLTESNVIHIKTYAFR